VEAPRATIRSVGIPFSVAARSNNDLKGEKMQVTPALQFFQK
jgi:hypothetical protein